MIFPLFVHEECSTTNIRKQWKEEETSDAQ